MLGPNATPSAIQVLVDGQVFNVDGPPLTRVPNEVKFSFDLMQNLVDSTIDLDFDIGLPAIGLDLDGGVQLKVGGTMHVGLGLSRNDGFFIDTSALNELTFTVAATIPELRATGTLGFLQIDAQDRFVEHPEAQRTNVGGTFSVDLRGGSDGKLTLAEMASLSFTEIVQAKFTGGAHIDLDLRTTLSGSRALPSLTAEFLFDWQFDSADTLAGSAFGNEPTLEFRNVYLDAGDAINNIVGPILKDFVDVIQPIAIALDLLTTPIPFVSEVVGDGFTTLRIIKLAAELFVGPRTLDAAEAVIRSIDKVLDVLKYLDGQGKVLIPVGDFLVPGLRNLKSLSLIHI